MALKYNSARSAIALRKVEAAATVPMTVDQIAIISGMGVDVVKKHVKELRRRERMHIGGYQGLTHLLVAGKGKDVPYARARQSEKPIPPELEDRPIDRRRVLKVKARPTGAARRDFLVAALFGEYRSGVAA